jgi:transcriptional regulator with XRE-family HTH domain
VELGHGLPSILSLVRIADRLGVTASYLLGEGDTDAV